MNVIRCDDSWRDAWNAFVSTSPNGSVYHRFEWRDINRESFGHRSCYLAVLDQDRIIGVFPIVQVRSRLFGNIGCSLPFVNYGGPCADSPEAEQLLLKEGCAVADEWRVDYLEIRSRTHLGSRFPIAGHKVSMTVDLDPDPEKLWGAFRTGHRQEIRRAYKNGLVARMGGQELLDDFYAVLSESWRNQGTPIYSKRFLRNVAEAFSGSLRLCVVYAGTEPAAAAFDVRHGDTFEGMWLGQRAKFRPQLVGYVLYWELIKHACGSRAHRFHLGRSTVSSGGESFKKKWNAKATQLYWQYVLRSVRDVPQLNVSNPRYKLAIDAWRRLPVPITRFVGPFIARGIP